MIDASTPFRKIGPVSQETFLSVAADLRSPLTRDDLVACHRAAGIHSGLVLAHAVKETQVGKTATARNNLLGLMQSGAFLSFLSWEDSVIELVRRWTDPGYKGGVYQPEDMPLLDYIVTYVGGPGCLSSGGKTCANGETWSGGETGSIGLYLRQTIDRLNQWQSSGGQTMANPFPVPVIYTLKKDFARFGLSKTQADKIRSHRFVNRNGMTPQIGVCHIQEGTAPGSLSYWASGQADASSTVMIQRDGSLLRVLDSEKDGPWTNGDVQSPSAKGQALISRIGGANPNLVTLSIEAEGYWQNAATDPQIATICWQLWEWMTTYRFGIQEIYRHADFNSVTRPNCPGVYFDQVIARLVAAQQATGPTPDPKPPTQTWPGKPDWLDPDLIPVLFPEAQPGGLRTSAWFRYATSTGRAPGRKAFVFKGESRELILFDDGLQIDRSGRLVGQE